MAERRRQVTDHPPAVIEPEELEVVEERATEIVDFVFTFQIQNDDDYQQAGDALKRATDAIKEIEEFFEPMRQSTYSAYKAVMARKNEVLEPVETARVHLRDLMGEYAKSVAAAQQAERARQYRLAQEKAEKAREAAFDKAIAEGDEEKANRVLDAPAVVSPQQVAVSTEPPSIEGISYRDVWTGELRGATDRDKEASLILLCAAIGKGEAPVSLVEVNTKMLNTLAKSLKDMMRFPGVVAVKKKIVVTKT